MQSFILLLSMLSFGNIEATPNHYRHLKKRATTTTTKKTETTKKAGTTKKATTSKKATTTKKASTTSIVQSVTTTASISSYTTTTTTTTSGLTGLTVASNPTATNAANAATTTTPALASQKTNGGISGGAIAGIVVAIVAVIAGLVAFVVIRKRQKARSNDNPRVSKTHLGPEPNTREMMYTTQPSGATMESYYYSPYNQSFNMDQPTLVVPSNTPVVVEQYTPAIAQQITSPVNEQPPHIETPSLGVFTVIATYTPTLSDELEIHVGDQVEILVEYDDGWCQGINLSRGHTKGVFPKHCADTNTAVTQAPVGVKRVSSMYNSK